jgi:osomolarity two-component system response regulator SSK1
MFLRKKKIKHQAAKDGQEAIEKWRTGGFHLILVSHLGFGTKRC